MARLAISSAQRRLLVFASTAFFIVSVYWCTSRLFATDYTPMETNKGANANPDVKLDIELFRADMPMSYGAYGRPGYDNITLLEPLSDKYIPTRWNKRRLIIIGDVHGMIDPLNALLEQCRYDSIWDHVITVGDMVNKGPDSAGVITRLMELGASAVRGNHEDRVLLAWASLGMQKGLQSDLASQDAEAHRGESMDLTTARSLTQAQLDWLKTLPVILTIEPLSTYVVHAGLVPGVALEQQDPWAVMNMRTIRYPRDELRRQEIEKKKKDAEKKLEDARKKNEEEEKKKQEEELKRLESASTAEEETPAANARRAAANDEAINTERYPMDHDMWIPTDSENYDLWTDLWNREQRRVAKPHRRTVVYGHHAKRGYQENAYTFGIDSACVKGGVLSAFIIEADGKDGWKHSTVQVPCKAEDTDK